MKPFLTALMAGAALVSGCISNPSPSQRLFALPTSPPAGQAEEVGSLAGRTLGFGPVSVASHLDRAFVAIRRNDALYEFADSLRWAAPVETLIQERLVAALLWVTGADDVRAFPWASIRPPDVQVSAHLVRFEVGPDRSADLVAYWFIREGDTRALLASGTFTDHQPVEGTSAPAAVEALDRALIAFAEELARRIPPP